MSEKAKWKAVGTVIIVVVLELLFGPGLIYLLKSKGIELYSASVASQHPAAILLQWGIVSIYPAILALLVWKRRGNKFLQDMYLEIRGKRQKIFVVCLGIILAAMFILAIGKTGDVLLVALNLLFYLVVVAFTEELILRGICPFLLRKSSKPVVYLLPNILFAGLHIFSYTGFQVLSIEYVMQFLSSQMLGLVITGLFFQLLKEYTGTLWVPVLVHAILDFSVLLAA